MKTLLIRFQILLIILLVLSPVLYLGFKKFTPQINLLKFDLAQKKINYPPLSPLRTAGTQIIDSSDNPVVLRGVNLISTNWGDDYRTWNPEAIKVAVKNWHANVIRTRIYQHEFELNPSQFFLELETQILSPARSNGAYIILHPWFGENDSLPDINGIKMWKAVARRYSNDPNIIFDLLAEPRDITFTELKDTYSTLIPEIRSIAPNSLIMVTGLDWGRDINSWLDSPLPYENIVYRTNPYNRTAEFPGYFGEIATKYPVFLGEFGTDNKLSMQEQDVSDLLGYADALNLGWTAWHFTASGCPCLLADEKAYAPTSYGQLVKDSLSGVKTGFTLPSFDLDPTKLYVYSDFFESGFADYSWGLTNHYGKNIQAEFHNSAGIYLNTSRRISQTTFSTFHLTFTSKLPKNFTLRFKSFDNQLSPTFQLKNGDNTISTSNIGLSTISALLIEALGTTPDSTPIVYDELYFQK